MRRSPCEVAGKLLRRRERASGSVRHGKDHFALPQPRGNLLWLVLALERPPYALLDLYRIGSRSRLYALGLRRLSRDYVPHERILALFKSFDPVARVDDGFCADRPCAVAIDCNSPRIATLRVLEDFRPDRPCYERHTCIEKRTVKRLLRLHGRGVTKRIGSFVPLGVVYCRADWAEFSNRLLEPQLSCNVLAQIRTRGDEIHVRPCLLGRNRGGNAADRAAEHKHID